jgi:PAS domain S-box-containing protein
MNKVLVVDNHLVMIKFMENLLIRDGYEVKTALGGLEALDLLKTYRPDIIFIDLIMPGIRGEKLCQLIRERPEFGSCYLIILSGIAAEEDINFTAFGADACIAKGPFNKLAVHIREVLKKAGFDPPERPLTGIIGLEDVYQREITKELITYRKHKEAMLDHISEGMLELTARGRVVYANPKAESMLGLRQRELISSNFSELFSGEDRRQVEEMLKSSSCGEGVRDESILLNRGELFLTLCAVPVSQGDSDSFIIILNDVTEYVTAKRQLEESLKEKDLLLREIHHRIKNNLSMVASMISLEQDNTDSGRMSHVLTDLKARISSISMVHERLFQGNGIYDLDFPEYAQDLTANLLSSIDGGAENIDVAFDIEAVRFTPDLAVPLGLIIVELCTNSVKYAFPEGFEPEEGIRRITISLRREDVEYILAVSDNGIGLPEGFDPQSGGSLGMKLVYALAVQLSGRVSLDGGPGFSLSLRFAIQ